MVKLKAGGLFVMFATVSIGSWMYVAINSKSEEEKIKDIGGVNKAVIGQKYVKKNGVVTISDEERKKREMVDFISKMRDQGTAGSGKKQE
jgi:lipopolysaccharide export LptBFGC system permease protein LptF